MFHRAFFNSIIDKTPTHAIFLILKYIKILKGTTTCFDLNRSSSGSVSVPR